MPHPKQAELDDEDLELERLRAERPQTRGECRTGPRPCPWVSCRHHLALDVDARGQVHVRFPDVALMRETCSLDVAERAHPPRGEEIAELMGVTRSRVQQIWTEGLQELGLIPATALIRHTTH